MRYAWSNFEYVPALARRILLVQRDGVERKAIIRALTLWGLEPFVAESLADVNGQLIHQPDFLLTEQRLPDGTCAKLLRRLARRCEPVRVGVILRADERPLPELPSLSPDAVFRRPMNMNWLRAWLRDQRPVLVRWSDLPSAHRRTCTFASPKMEQVL